LKPSRIEKRPKGNSRFDVIWFHSIQESLTLKPL
jgi:hypothetical protein